VEEISGAVEEISQPFTRLPVEGISDPVEQFS
jgi:hypothetical protein